MSHFATATFAKGALAAVLAGCIILPGHAGEAQMRLAAEKLDPDKFEKKLQDTRENIGKERTTVPPATAGTNQIVVDICKKNPQLPQCKL